MKSWIEREEEIERIKQNIQVQLKREAELKDELSKATAQADPAK